MQEKADYLIISASGKQLYCRDNTFEDALQAARELVIEEPLFQVEIHKLNLVAKVATRVPDPTVMLIEESKR